jgi:hypothetical protein
MTTLRRGTLIGILAQCLCQVLEAEELICQRLPDSLSGRHQGTLEKFVHPNILTAIKGLHLFIILRLAIIIFIFFIFSRSHDSTLH